MIVIGCSHGKYLAKDIAKQVKASYSELESRKFPDSETYIRFRIDLNKQSVILVQSFYENVNDCLVEVLLAAQGAKRLGAKKVTLVAPYFPYLRQDKQFNKGEAISIGIIGKIISENLDSIYVMDPHLHRERTLNHVFSIHNKKLSAYPLIADYIKKNIKNPIIVGPDYESYKWAETVAKLLGCESVILEKKRLGPRKVVISLNKKVNFKNKNVVIVDDIISTGHTILETSRNLKKFNVDKLTVICVHGIFVENALSKLKKAMINVVSCNTIPGSTNKIDVSEIIAESLINKR